VDVGGDVGLGQGQQVVPAMAGDPAIGQSGPRLPFEHHHEPQAFGQSGIQLQTGQQGGGLDDQAYGRYDNITDPEVRELVVQGKWLASLEQAVASEVERVSQALTGRLKQLGERYGEALPAISARVEELEARVAGHLEQMGFAWN
jgi:hypothetical protein